MNQTAPTLLAYLGAAFFEIAGSFSFWAVLRLGKSVWWLLPGMVSLILFAAALTRANLDFAGRAYAAYGGIYIASSLLWLWAVESQTPDRWDVAGGALCILGALVILYGHHMAA